MDVFLVFVGILAGTVGFMYLLVKVCMMVGGNGKKADKSSIPATPVKPEVTARHT